MENGTAVDAAIAAAICDGIFNAQSTGIGGGHFSLIYLRFGSISQVFGKILSKFKRQNC